MEAKSKILIVEDERIVAEDIRRSLKKLGYEVCGVVSTGREALRKVQQLHPDLVLMDIVLRLDMNGIETAERIQASHDVPVIYLTAYADEETLDRAKKTQPYGYILKPFEDRELQTTIEMALYKHRTERRIKENEAWLSTTLRSLAEGVIATDDHGAILFMNPVAEAITGRSFAEVSGKPFEAVFSVEDARKGAVKPVEVMLGRSRAKPFSGQVRLAAAGGQAVEVDLSVSAIRNERGRVFGAVLAFQDVTQRKTTEEALKESEREKNLILSSVSELVVYMDLDLRIIWANEAAGRSVGLDAARLKGRRCHEVWYRTPRPCGVCAVQETVRQGRSVELEIEEKTGQVWLSRGYPVRNHAGVVTGVVEVSREITREKQAEEQLEKERQFVNTLLQTSPAFYIALDSSGRILLMNQTLLQALGCTHEEASGRDFLESFVHPDDREALSAVFRKHLKHTDPTVHESRLASKDGRETIVEWHVRSVFHRKGQLETIFALGLDVTERRRVERERERIEVQLQQIQKMEAIGTLTGGVAHDFNNLLTAIQGCADMAILRVRSEDAIHRDLREIQLAAGRAAELTRQLLLFSSKHPTRFVPMDLNQTVGDLLKMLHRLIGEDVGISTVLNPELWSFRGDKGTIEQVLMNLTVNARDAMPKGGRITIRTENVRVDESMCASQPGARPGDFVRLSVSDTGTGIDPEILPRIFEPFFSTKAPGKGTGLGLSVVYGIVRQHSGWLTVESARGTGSLFEMYLPAVKERVVTRQDDQVSLEAFRGNGERILAVEDADGIREFLRNAFQEYGYMVFLAPDATEAIRLFKKHRGHFDLVFSDVVLPDKSGIELIEILLEEKPDLPVLLSSGYTDQKSQWSVIQNRRLPFIHKPYSLSALLKTVREVINKK